MIASGLFIRMWWSARRRKCARIGISRRFNTASFNDLVRLFFLFCFQLARDQNFFPLGNSSSASSTGYYSLSACNPWLRLVMLKQKENRWVRLKTDFSRCYEGFPCPTRTVCVNFQYYIWSTFFESWRVRADNDIDFLQNSKWYVELSIDSQKQACSRSDRWSDDDLGEISADYRFTGDRSWTNNRSLKRYWHPTIIDRYIDSR